jgi:aminopeptidase
MKSFPPFDLKRLMSTVFEPTEGKRLCILIDLENPADVEDFGFLQDESLTILSGV